MQAPRVKETLDAASRYLAAGLSVIPLEPKGKRPAYRLLPKSSITGAPQWEQYQQRIPTEEEITRWFGTGGYNVGIVAGQISGGLVIIDFDLLESFDQWCEQDMSRWLFPTVETANGRHVYVRVSERLVGNRRNQTRKIDLRGEGGYVVAPPSLHPSGHKYRWIMGQWSAVPTVSSLDEIGLPDSIFLRDRVTPTMPPLRKGQPGMPMSIYSFVAQGTREGNRDRKAYYSACECRDAGISPEQAVEWITWGLERSNPDKDPQQWAVEKVRSAYGTYVR